MMAVRKKDGNYINAQIGERIQFLRVNLLGLNTYEFSEAMDMTPEVLYKYERGLHVVPAYMAARIIHEYGISPGWLLSVD